MNGNQYNSKEMMGRTSFNGNNDHNMNALSTDIPYFERQESDDFAALQEARRIIDVLNHRVRSLENINIDLEYRLEQQAKQTMQAEHEYTEIDRTWKMKYAEMEKEKDEWSKKYESQILKTERLRDHLNRTERELYGMLQRKYQLMRGGMPHVATEVNKVGGTSSQTGLSESANGMHQSLSSHTSPSQPLPRNQQNNTPLSSSGATENLCEVYKNLSPKQRQRRVLIDMGDFLGT